MNSGNDQPAAGREHDRYYIVSGEEVDRIVLPLTVVHAYVQLLRRRITGGEFDSTFDVDQSLARMEEATRSISDQLRAIMAATTQMGKDVN